MEDLKDSSSSNSNRTSPSVAVTRSGDGDGDDHLVVGAPLSAEAAADAKTATGGGSDGVPKSPRGARLVCAVCRTKAAAKSCAFQCCSGCCPSSTTSASSSSSLSRHEEEEAGGGAPNDAAEKAATHDDKADSSSSSAAAIAVAAAAPSSAARVCEYHQRARVQSEFRKRVLDGTTPAQLLAKQIRARQLPPGRFREKRFAYQGDTVRIWDWSAFASSHPKALEEAVRKSAKRRKQTMRHPPHNDDNNDHPALKRNDSNAHRTGATAKRRPRRQDRFRQFLDARLAETKHPPQAALDSSSAVM
jgi:hypothetical protein